MKAINIKKKLYVLLTLFFCISLQGTSTTEPDTTQPSTRESDIKVSRNCENNEVSQQAFDTFELNQIRKPVPHHAKPSQKPNNTGVQNMAEPYNMPESPSKPGFLDINFVHDKSGYVISTLGYNSAPKAVAIQENNKIVIAGVRDDYPTLARYNAHGVNDDGTIDVLDKTFATVPYGPGVIIQTSLGKNARFNAVAIQQLGQTAIAVGSAQGKCLLACYYDNGTLNTLFGENGIIKTNIIGQLNAVAIQKDHKVVATGYSNYNTTDRQILLIRYDEYGLLDDTFGIQGVVITPVERLAQANAITIQEDNKIVVVGTFANNNGITSMLIARYNNEDGSLDQSFGSNGIVILSVGKNNSFAYDVAIQKDGSIVIVGSSISPYDKSQFTIIRLNPDGSKDGFFGTDGIVTITPTLYRNDIAYATSVALDKNDKIIVMGHTMAMTNSLEYNYFSLIRLNQNGTLDPRFGHQGIWSEPLKLGNNFNRNRLPVFGALQNDSEKIVLAGSYSSNHPTTTNQWAIARYLN